MKDVEVSVLVANFNGEDCLAECLDSLRAQDCDIGLEVLVHDDASSDGSLALLAERYPEVRVLGSPVNIGYCASNNRMAEQARGRWLLLLNNDAALLPNALRRLREAAGRQPDAVLGLPQYDAASGELVDRGSLFDPFLNPIPNLDPLRSDVGMVSGACLWVSAELWRRLGGFPEWFGAVAEDAWLCLVARLWGYPVRVLAESGFRHRMGASLGGGRVVGNRLSSTLRRRSLSERNKLYVATMTYPGVLVTLLLPHVLLLLVEGLVLALACRQVAILRDIYLAALAALWRERWRLWRARRAIQDQAGVGGRNFRAIFLWLPQKLRLLARHGWPVVR